MVSVPAAEDYLARSEGMYAILSTDAGLLPPEDRARVLEAHRILGRAAEAETFDPQPEGIHMPVVVASVAETWIRGILVDKED